MIVFMLTVCAGLVALFNTYVALAVCAVAAVAAWKRIGE